MSSITQLTTVPADLIGAQALHPQKPIERHPRKARTSGKPAPDGSPRLVIRDGAEDGLFVYAILDGATGQVVAQIAREDVAKLAARPDYEAGQVVDTKV